MTEVQQERFHGDDAIEKSAEMKSGIPASEMRRKDAASVV